MKKKIIIISLIIIILLIVIGTYFILINNKENWRDIFKISNVGKESLFTKYIDGKIENTTNYSYSNIYIILKFDDNIEKKVYVGDMNENEIEDWSLYMEEEYWDYKIDRIEYIKD